MKHHWQNFFLVLFIQNKILFFFLVGGGGGGGGGQGEILFLWPLLGVKGLALKNSFGMETQDFWKVIKQYLDQLYICLQK